MSAEQKTATNFREIFLEGFTGLLEDPRSLPTRRRVQIAYEFRSKFPGLIERHKGVGGALEYALAGVSRSSPIDDDQIEPQPVIEGHSNDELWQSHLKEAVQGLGNFCVVRFDYDLKHDLIQMGAALDSISPVSLQPALYGALENYYASRQKHLDSDPW